MNTVVREQHELITIVMAALCGEATEEQVARLNERIIADEQCRVFLMNLISQEAWLSWHATTAQGLEQLSSRVDDIVRPRNVENECLPLAVELGKLNDSINAAISNGAALPNRQIERRTVLRGIDRDRLWSLPRVAAVLMLAIGAAFGAVASRWWHDSTGSPTFPLTDSGFEPERYGDRPLTASYEARLRQGTACVWAPEMRSRLGSQDPLQSGESLNLIAGLAELELSWPMRGEASLRLEGPAGLVLMADGGASLNYGKLTAEVTLQYDGFTVETPAGRVVVSGDTHFGVVVSNGAIEVHVFKGQADLVAPWISGAETRDKLVVRRGRSIRLSPTSSGELVVSRGPALLNRFASQVSMASDVLDISEEYVRTIKQAAPIVYWRFDSPQSNVVRNEMGEQYRATVVGKPSWVDERGNMSVEFGAGLNTEELRAFLVADEPLKDLNTSTYTIEVWAKPSHYHLGSMVGLIGAGSQNAPKGAHGMLLELGGMRGYHSSIEYPGRVRFLHRDPPSHDTASGTSCFSPEPYLLRKWQHIAAVKDRSEIRLYVNGKLVASTADKAGLSTGLELLVGQMDRERDWRPFVGQLDELAFYPRALTEEEIEQHHRLVRPNAVSAREI